VPKIGSNYLYTAGTGGAAITRSCRWTPDIGIAGFYDVYVYYQIGANRTAGATYRVTYSGGVVSSLQNQYSATPNLGGWFQVGTNLPFATGRGGYVDLGNDAVDTALVSADAAKFVLAAPFAAPAITGQPLDQAVTAGTSATFSATATGTAPLAYQWRFNGTNIGGATASSYTRNNAQPADAGSYSVDVTNFLGSATSSNALLAVNVPPTITQQPLDQWVIAGAAATFSAVATGTAPLSYQWRFNGTNINNATDSSYTRSNAQSADAGIYSLVVSNLAGSAGSSNAVLTVNVPPSITAQPQSLSVIAGSNATFTILAEGTEPLSYQWRFNGTNLAAGTTSAYTCNNAQPVNAGAYSVLVSNLAGSITSTDAVLSVTVPAPPQIDSISLLPGGQVQLQVSGVPGHYAVDAATNLADWSELTNFTTGAATFDYVDTETNLIQRFYRVRRMP
jgi:hypothetical protein